MLESVVKILVSAYSPCLNLGSLTFQQSFTCIHLGLIAFRLNVFCLLFPQENHAN